MRLRKQFPHVKPASQNNNIVLLSAFFEIHINESYLFDFIYAPLRLRPPGYSGTFHVTLALRREKMFQDASMINKNGILIRHLVLSRILYRSDKLRLDDRSKDTVTVRQRKNPDQSISHSRPYVHNESKPLKTVASVSSSFSAQPSRPRASPSHRPRPRAPSRRRARSSTSLP